MDFIDLLNRARLAIEHFASDMKQVRLKCDASCNAKPRGSG